jgi:hypothetical protein
MAVTSISSPPPMTTRKVDRTSAAGMFTAVGLCMRVYDLKERHHFHLGHDEVPKGSLSGPVEAGRALDASNRVAAS